MDNRSEQQQLILYVTSQDCIDEEINALINRLYNDLLFRIYVVIAEDRTFAIFFMDALDSFFVRFEKDMPFLEKRPRYLPKPPSFIITIMIVAYIKAPKRENPVILAFQ